MIPRTTIFPGEFDSARHDSLPNGTGASWSAPSRGLRSRPFNTAQDGRSWANTRPADRSRNGRTGRARDSGMAFSPRLGGKIMAADCATLAQYRAAGLVLSDWLPP